MSRASKVKGAAFEREIAKIIGGALGIKVDRNLEQVRSSGSDLRVRHWNIECKRRARISCYEWIEQAQRACKENESYAVVFRADGQQPQVIISMDDFLWLLETSCLA